MIRKHEYTVRKLSPEVSSSGGVGPSDELPQSGEYLLLNGSGVERSRSGIVVNANEGKPSTVVIRYFHFEYLVGGDAIVSSPCKIFGDAIFKQKI